MPFRTFDSKGIISGFPLGLKKWEDIFQSVKSRGIFEQIRKVKENQRKYWKSQGFYYFLVIFK